MSAEPPRSKAELLRLQREGRARWEALLTSVPRERLSEEGASGELSVKDVVAHLAAWERHAAERLRVFASGAAPEPLPPPGMTWAEYEHRFNERVRKLWRERSWDQVRAEAEATYAEFLAALEGVPEDILFREELPVWQTAAFNGYLHYVDFADDVRRWLGSR